MAERLLFRNRGAAPRNRLLSQKVMIERIGRYQIRGELGKGGFGRVYLAFDPKVERRVAIKVLDADADRSLADRFHTEAMAAGNLHHKNIVTVHEFGEEDGKQFLVMEYLEGQDLHVTIGRKAPLTLLEKVEIMSQVADGLQYAHRNGVIHRDVKPANIMLLVDKSVKIMDFGIARLIKQTSARLTQSGYMVGTAAYMAPEQFRDAEIDALCDIWAYGVIYYQLLTGQNPFDAPDPAAAMYRVTNLNPPAATALNPECPEALSQVISRLLSRDRERRYQSLEDAQFDVEPVLSVLRRRRAAELLPQARALLDAGKVEEAQPVVREIVELDRGNPEGRKLRELVHRELKQLSVRPRVAALVKKADSEASNHRYTEAIRSLEDAFRLDPSDSSIQVRIGKLQTAKEQIERVARLIEQARAQFEAKNLSGAFKDLNEARGIDPENQEVQQLLAQIRGEMEAREHERRLREGIGRAKGLLMMNAFEEAAQILRTLADENPGADRIEQLADEVRRQKAEHERAERFQAEIAACKDLLKRSEFAEAVPRLERLAREFPQDKHVPALLAYARDELSARRRGKLIEEMERDARALLESRDFGRAVQLAEEGLRMYPGEERLARLIQAILFAKSEHEKNLLVETGIQQAQQMRREARLEEAVGIVNALIEQHGSVPRLASLREDLRREIQERDDRQREDELRRAMIEARDLLEQGRPDTATALLQRTTSLYPKEADLQALLEQARLAKEEVEKQKAVQEILARAAERERTSDWDAALVLLEAGLQKYGVLPPLSDAFGRIQTQKIAAQEKGRIAELVARGEWGPALALAEAALKAHPGNAALKRIYEQVQSERQMALEATCSNVERFLEATDVGRAREILERKRQVYGDDPRLRALEGEIENAQFRKQRLAAARNHLGKHDLKAAEAAAREILERHPDDPEARGLLQEIVQQREEEQRKEEYEKGRIEVDLLLRKQKFDNALRLLEKLLEQFPNDRLLQVDLNGAREAKERFERKQLYEKSRAEADRLLRNREFDAGIRLLEKLAGQFPKERVIEEDLKSARAAKERHERNELHEKDRLEVEQLIRNREFDAAIGKLQALLKRFPDDPLFEQYMETAAKAKEAQERNRYYKLGLEKAQQLVRERAFIPAIRALDLLLKQFPGDPALEDELKAAFAAKELYEGRQRVNERVAELEALYRKGKAAAVKEQALALLAEVEEPRARELLAWAESALARREEERRIEPAAAPENRNKKLWAVWAGLGTLLAALSGWGLWLFLVSHGPPALNVKPADIAFEYKVGQPNLPPAQAVTVTSGHSAHPWTVIASDQWVSAIPQGEKAPSKLLISVDPKRLAAGFYHGVVLVTLADTGTLKELHVRLTVRAEEAKLVETPARPATVVQQVKKAAAVVPQTREVSDVKQLPPPPTPQEEKDPVVDCHSPTYGGSLAGTLTWMGELATGGELVIGRRGVVSGPAARLAGKRFPGCDVNIVRISSGIAIEEAPSAANNFSTLKLRNTGPGPVSPVTVRWEVK